MLQAFYIIFPEMQETPERPSLLEMKKHCVEVPAAPDPSVTITVY